MSETIDPLKLKERAEHLEWVFKQHPDVEIIQRLHKSLERLIGDAKACKLREPVFGLPTPRFRPTDIWPTEGGKRLDQAFFEFFLEIRGAPANQPAKERDEPTLREFVKYILGFPEEGIVQLFQEAERFLKQPRHSIEKAHGEALARRLQDKAIDLSSSRATEMSPVIPELSRMASEIARAVHGQATEKRKDA